MRSEVIEYAPAKYMAAETLSGLAISPYFGVNSTANVISGRITQLYIFHTRIVFLPALSEVRDDSVRAVSIQAAGSLVA